MNLICHHTGSNKNSPSSMNKMLKITSRVRFSLIKKHRALSIQSVLQRAVEIRNSSSLECLCHRHLKVGLMIDWNNKTYSLSSERRQDLLSSKLSHQTSIITWLETRKSTSKGICRRMSWLVIAIWTILDSRRLNLENKAPFRLSLIQNWQC